MRPAWSNFCRLAEPWVLLAALAMLPKLALSVWLPPASAVSSRWPPFFSVSLRIPWKQLMRGYLRTLAAVVLAAVWLESKGMSSSSVGLLG